MAIHPTAVVSPNAEIGKNVEIGPYAVIDDDVRIGDDCFIDAHVKIGQYTTIGPRCRIYFGAFVGADLRRVYHRNYHNATDDFGAVKHVVSERGFKSIYSFKKRSRVEGMRSRFFSEVGSAGNGGNVKIRA